MFDFRIIRYLFLFSSYSSRTRFILIFGVATTPGAVYQSLNHSVLSLLSVQIFKSESSMCFLTSGLSGSPQIFIKVCPVCLT